MRSSAALADAKLMLEKARQDMYSLGTVGSLDVGFMDEYEPPPHIDGIPELHAVLDHVAAKWQGDVRDYERARYREPGTQPGTFAPRSPNIAKQTGIELPVPTGSDFCKLDCAEKNELVWAVLKYLTDNSALFPLGQDYKIHRSATVHGEELVNLITEALYGEPGVPSDGEASWPLPSELGRGDDEASRPLPSEIGSGDDTGPRDLPADATATPESLLRSLATLSVVANNWKPISPFAPIGDPGVRQKYIEEIRSICAHMVVGRQRFHEKQWYDENPQNPVPLRHIAALTLAKERVIYEAMTQGTVIGWPDMIPPSPEGSAAPNSAFVAP